MTSRLTSVKNIERAIRLILHHISLHQPVSHKKIVEKSIHINSHIIITHTYRLFGLRGCLPLIVLAPTRLDLRTFELLTATMKSGRKLLQTVALKLGLTCQVLIYRRLFMHLCLLHSTDLLVFDVPWYLYLFLVLILQDILHVSPVFMI